MVAIIFLSSYKIAFSAFLDSFLVESLRDSFKLSLATGRFSDSGKIARESPVFNICQENNRTSYRPISVLPFLSRFF